jgi:hypothetical protein
MTGPVIRPRGDRAGLGDSDPDRPALVAEAILGCVQ